MGMKRRIPMGVSRLLAGCLLGFIARGIAQDASVPAGQSSSQSSSQSSQQPSTHRSVHHVQVEDDDAAHPPAELSEAEAAIGRRDYAAAEPLLQKLVGHDPANYVGWFDLGFVENALGKTDESIAAYRKSVAAKPDVFESNLNLGLQLAKTGQADAEEFLRAATHLKPTAYAAEGQYRAWVGLAHVVEKLRPEEALADYRLAAALQPNQAEPHLAAGQILEQENKFAESEKEYKEALAIEPGSVDAVIGLANVSMKEGRFSDAEEYLRKLLVGHADSGAVHIQLGRVLAVDGKTDAAAAELQMGVKLAPADDGAQRDLAALYSAAGKNELAEGSYRLLVAAHPNDAELHRGLGQAELRQKKYADAQQEFLNTVKLKPDLGDAYGDLAFAASENKNYPLVIRALDARAKLLAEVPITYFLRASAYDHLRDLRKAAENYHLFLKVANGKYPDQEWQAKHRLIAIEPKK
jgi:Tfp pilus assembly protein PilF